MRHCCKFKADDIYFLVDDPVYKIRMLSVGFCPICEKPVAELQKIRFDGVVETEKFVGIKAHEIAIKSQKEIEYSMQALNYQKVKQKPTGWKYGENKQYKDGKIRQFAKDFYGNKELIKVVDN